MPFHQNCGIVIVLATNRQSKRQLNSNTPAGHTSCQNLKADRQLGAITTAGQRGGWATGLMEAPGLQVPPNRQRIPMTNGLVMGTATEFGGGVELHCHPQELNGFVPPTVVFRRADFQIRSSARTQKRNLL